MKVLAFALAALAAVPLSGCVGDASLAVACGTRVAPDDVPLRAPRQGGSGDATLRIRVLDADNASISRAAVLAFWPGADGGLDLVALRTGGDGIATLHAPSGASVRVWGGDLTWTGDETVTMGQPVRPNYPGADPGTLELVANTRVGFLDGFWVQLVPMIGLPVAVGPTRVWQPGELEWATEHRLRLLEELYVRLEWRNNSNGLLDLANAVGRGDEWTQWNQAVQAEQGIHIEELTLDRAALEAGGWTTGTGLSLGPALGEGGGFTNPAGKGQDWHIRWQARFRQDPSLGDLCAAGEPAPRDVTDG